MPFYRNIFYLFSSINLELSVKVLVLDLVEINSKNLSYVSLYLGFSLASCSNLIKSFISVHALFKTSFISANSLSLFFPSIYSCKSNWITLGAYFAWDILKSLCSSITNSTPLIISGTIISLTITKNKLNFNLSSGVL